jgi:hypothetical protein
MKPGSRGTTMIEVHPALRDARLVNRNGSLTYELDAAADDRVMARLFPKYVGPTIPLVRVDACVQKAGQKAGQKAR